MLVHQSPCEWNKNLVRITETCEDETSPAYFEKLPEPIASVQGKKYPLVQVSEAFGKPVVVPIDLPAVS